MSLTFWDLWFIIMSQIVIAKLVLWEIEDKLKK